MVPIMFRSRLPICCNLKFCCIPNPSLISLKNCDHHQCYKNSQEINSHVFFCHYYGVAILCNLLIFFWGIIFSSLLPYSSSMDLLVFALFIGLLFLSFLVVFRHVTCPFFFNMYVDTIIASCPPTSSLPYTYQHTSTLTHAKQSCKHNCP